MGGHGGPFEGNVRWQIAQILGGTLYGKNLVILKCFYGIRTAKR